MMMFTEIIKLSDTFQQISLEGKMKMGFYLEMP